jgi:hypothetical protein
MADKESKPDASLLAALVGQRGGPSVDPSDPVYIVASILQAAINDAAATLAKTVADATDQTATAIVLSENAARARSETIVTDSARWAGEQIRLAGTDAAKAILQQTEDQVERVQSAAQTVRWGVWVACSASAVSLCAALFVLFK